MRTCAVFDRSLNRIRPHLVISWRSTEWLSLPCVVQPALSEPTAREARREKADWILFVAGNGASRSLFDPRSSIWRNESAEAGQTIVTGRNLRPSGDKDTRKILPKLSFGEDSMTLVQLCGSHLVDARKRSTARTKPYESFPLERLPS